MASNHGRYFLLRKNFFSWLLPWAVGLLSFIAMMASGAAFGVSAFFSGWGDRLDRELTVILPAQPTLESSVQDDMAVAALEFLRQSAGIRVAQLQTPEELASLLEPWLGGVGEAETGVSGLELPRVISLEKQAGAPAFDIESVRLGLTAIWPSAEIEDHGSWRTGLTVFLRSVEGISIVMVVALLISSCIIVGLATAGSLAVHRDIAQLMHLVGASDHFIAGEFRYLTLVSALKGAIGAEVAAIVLMFLVRLVFDRFGVGIGEVPVQLWQWSAIAFLPFFMVIISTTAAHITVVRNLKTMF